MICSSQRSFSRYAWLNLIAISLLPIGSDFGFAQARSQLAKAPASPGVAPSAPVLLSIVPAVGSAGDVIELEGTSLGATPADQRVVFHSTAYPGVHLVGHITSVQRLGLDPQGNPRRRLEVLVPTGVRDGEVEVLVRGSGGPVSAGSLPFAASPTLWGAVHGNNNIGFVYLDPFGGFLPSAVVLYGENLAAATAVTFVDELAQNLPSPSWFVGVPPTANYEVPAGFDAITVSLPSSGYGFFDCFDAARLVVEVTSAAGVSNRIELRVRKVVTGLPGSFPATISGLVVPPGVRAGDIEVRYNLLAQPASEEWDLVPEYFDPVSGLFVPCTPRPSSDGLLGLGLDLVAGAPEFVGSIPELVGPGHSHRFVWDSCADLPGYVGSTRLRLQPVPGANTIFDCATTRWVTQAIAVANPSAQRTVREDFATTEFLDAAATTADWNTVSELLIGTGTIANQPFGVGTADLLLGAGRDYEFRTDTGEIFDVTVASNPQPLIVANPGAALGEFHFRTLVVAAGTRVTGVGSAPVVVRLAGTGDPFVTVADIAGEIELRGQPGQAATTTTPGAGGLGGPGGGSGGHGGVIQVSGAQQRVLALTPAQAGSGNGGGGPGQSLTYVTTAGTSQPRSGPGGGGGHATGGGDGVNQVTGVRAAAGRGGAIVGDKHVRDRFGGSGGGGGGALPYRIGSGSLQARSGGGGGGGGGAFLLWAAGSIHVVGEIDCGGGAGGTGHNPAAGGGGGSGGTIALRALGFVRIGTLARVTADGGLGGLTAPGSSSNYAGGPGAVGRLLFEAQAGVVLPASLDLSNVGPRVLATPSLGSVGTGVDGALDLRMQSGVFVIDTASGTVTHPDGSVVLTAASGAGEFHLTNLYVPEAVTLRVTGPAGLILRVVDTALVAGTVDGSGGDGGLPDFSIPGVPMPGLGGLAGPGGGHGGAGGIAQGPFQVDGGDGQLPLSALGSNDQPTSDQPTTLPVPVAGPVFAATGGGSIAGCAGPTCQAGSGGGGGHADWGQAAQPPFGTPGTAAPGDGGSPLGTPSFDGPDGVARVAGGAGGGGGGASGNGLVGGSLESSVGSGGGGGGGYLEIVAGFSFRITGTARLLANGGNAFHAARYAGNGGGGAGGGIVIRSNGMLTLESPGPVISAAGGLANRPAEPALPVEVNDEAIGGNGSHGRILLESAFGHSTSPGAAVLRPEPSLGRFVEAFAVDSEALTLPYSIVANGVRSTGTDTISLATMPPLDGTALPFFELLFSGARERPATPGLPDAFGAWTDDLEALQGQDFVRLRFILYGSPTATLQPAVDAVELLFEPQP